MRKNYIAATKIILGLAIILSAGCKRDKIVPDVPPVNPTPPTTNIVNDATQVTASVSGIVLNESNAPIANAVVTSGVATTTTNSNGMFIFQNISLSKENGSVTVVKAGYFKGVRSFKTTASKNHTIRLQLMQKVLSGTVNATAGGIINSNGGATIIFPAAAFVTSTGVAYSGTVNVYSRWIDPTAANLAFVIPGDLRGIGTNGAENLLETYGMVGAELEDASGNILKIATGKKATISFPLPASLLATAPATIQLWHFDDATARWKENGMATKTGSTYSAQVDKFSFWNCDFGNANFINLDYTLINATTSTPLVSTYTRIKRANGNYGYGYSNNTGLVTGSVPRNETLVLEVLSLCNTVIYSQNVGPFLASTSLNSLNVTIPTSLYINYTGSLINCNGGNLSNGYLLFYSSFGNGVFVNPDINGSLSFSILNCSNSSLSYNYQAFDNINLVQSPEITGSATNGTVNLGNISACGTIGGPGVYIAGYEWSSGGFSIAKLWKNGVGINLTDGTNYAKAKSVFISGTDIYVAGFESGIYNVNNGNIYVAKVWKNGIPTNLSNLNNQADANSVVVVGSDVYVGGVENNKGKVWKNGTTILGLPDVSNIQSVFVDGTDVYAVGSVYAGPAGGGTMRAAYWKNGVVTYLSTGMGNYAKAYSIKVSNGDVYVSGFEGGNYYLEETFRAKVWKNGVVSNLITSTSGSQATSIYLSGSDVYVEGYERDITNQRYEEKIWKNSVAASFNPAATYTSFPEDYNSLFVFGNDFYKVGQLNSLAVFWKNGVLSQLSNVNSSKASSIFVK